MSEFLIRIRHSALFLFRRRALRVTMTDSQSRKHELLRPPSKPPQETLPLCGDCCCFAVDCLNSSDIAKELVTSSRVQSSVAWLFPAVDPSSCRLHRSQATRPADDPASERASERRRNGLQRGFLGVGARRTVDPMVRAPWCVNFESVHGRRLRLTDVDID